MPVRRLYGHDQDELPPTTGSFGHPRYVVGSAPSCPSGQGSALPSAFQLTLSSSAPSLGGIGAAVQVVVMYLSQSTDHFMIIDTGLDGLDILFGPALSFRPFSAPSLRAHEIILLLGFTKFVKQT